MATGTRLALESPTSSRPSLRSRDGAVAARILVELERTLQHEILAELVGMRCRSEVEDG